MVRGRTSPATRCATPTRGWCTFLDHLDALGVTGEVSFLLTADHGFERADPAVGGSWRPALDALGIPYRDEGPGFVYLL